MLHCQPVQEGQDLVKAGETEQARVPDRGCLGRQLEHGRQQVQGARPTGTTAANSKYKHLIPVLQALATISSALSLLEAGQLGVIRYPEDNGPTYIFNHHCLKLFHCGTSTYQKINNYFVL